ncbi:Fic family protein [Sorangium sp. So ce362]|uniref:Fic family protein n=1 Tax=Sorangium sp. So ce362 TaxID=3133303 RepID=UPI003F633008
MTTKRATARKSAAPARRKATRTPARATRTGARKKSAAAKAKKTTRVAAKRASASKARKTAAKKKTTKATKPTRAAAKLRTTKARAKARATKVKARATKAKATRAKTARAKAPKAKATRARVAKPRAAKTKAAKARTAKTRAVAGRTRRAKAAKPKLARVKAAKKPKLARVKATKKPKLTRVKATKPRLARRKIAARSERVLAAPAAEPTKLRKKLRLDDKPKLKEKLKLKADVEQAAPVEAERPRRTSDKPQRTSDRPQRASDRPQRASDRPQRASDRPAAEKKSGRPGALKGKVSIERRPGRVPLREPPRVVTLPLPMLPPPRRATIEERSAIIEQRLNAQTEEFRRRYIDSLDMSWIYHDSALEGVVYTFDELRAALNGPAPLVTDSSLQPTYDDIRRHKEAIVYVREQGANKRAPVTLDCVRKLYLILHPEEGDLKTVKYRKDIPQHRLYFHEYAPPDKIAYKVRQIIDWLSDPETRKTRNGIRIAARAHYDLLRVYPFPNDSGKVARLFMNMLLLRTGLPPSIIHSTERQRYYEALKGSATTVLQMVQESVENALASVEKLLDEHETRKRAFVS